MSALPITVCRVSTPDGAKAYVTCLTHEHIFARGLAPEAILGVLTRELGPGEAIAPESFARNRVFVDFLHALIARRAPEMPGFLAAARRQGEGWVYIIDQRTPSPGDAVPTEDIVGAFEVRGGAPVPGSYRPNPNHQVLAAHGFLNLGAELNAALLEELAQKG